MPFDCDLSAARMSISERRPLAPSGGDKRGGRRSFLPRPVARKGLVFDAREGKENGGSNFEFAKPLDPTPPPTAAPVFSGQELEGRSMAELVRGRIASLFSHCHGRPSNFRSC